MLLGIPIEDSLNRHKYFATNENSRNFLNSDQKLFNRILKYEIPFKDIQTWCFERVLKDSKTQKEAALQLGVDPGTISRQLKKKGKATDLYP
jgi:hypothetical protein